MQRSSGSRSGGSPPEALTATERLAHWAVPARHAPLGDDVATAAKRALVDWVAAAIAGAGEPATRAVREAVVTPHERGTSDIVPGPPGVPMRIAALVNGTSAHAAEVDDSYRDGLYHPGAPTIAAALAASQTSELRGTDLLRQVVIGYEIGTRVAVALQPAHYRYWHTTGTVGTIGAAAAVATALDLDAIRFAHALAISATMAAGLQQTIRSTNTSKALHAGHAAEAGTLAAMLAARGSTGASEILEGAAGLGEAMGDAPDWARVLSDLGTRFNINDITFKNHACCGHAFAAIDGALELNAVHRLDPARIERIDIGTYAAALEIAGIDRPGTPSEARFSLAFCVAAALHVGPLGPSAFAEPLLSDRRVRTLMDRVTLGVDPELDRMFPERRAARVAIALEGGSTVRILITTRKGDPDDPLTDDELGRKFLQLTEPLLGTAAAGDLLGRLWSIEEASDLRSLIDPRAFA